MSETVTITESEARRTLSGNLIRLISELAAGQPALKRGETYDYGQRMKNRKELRALNLAYAFVRGVPYAKLERSCHEEPPLDRSLEKILNFSFPGYVSTIKMPIRSDFVRWMKGEEQEFFKAKEAARAEVVPAVAE